MRKKSLLLTAAALMLVGGSHAQVAPSPVDPLFAPEQGQTRAVLVLQDGRVVAKRYGAGYSDANRFLSWSMAKTVTGMLVGELVAEGRLRLDAPVPLVEWQRPGDPRATITLRQLLQMSSGLRHIEVGNPVENSDTNQAEFVVGSGAMAAYAIAQPLEAKPGTKFEYSSLTSIILAELITRTLTPSQDPRVRAEAYRRFAFERLFAPAGIKSAFLEFDGAGTQVGGSLIYMTLDDWGRFGQVLLTGRGVDGREVVDPDWLAFMKAPSPTNPGYGAQTWTNLPAGREGPKFPLAPADTVSAEGHLGQHVTVSAAKRAVVVRLGNTPETEFGRTSVAIGQLLGRLPG